MSIEKRNPSSVNWNERYRNLLDSLNIGYNLLDMDETILEVNETLLKMTGAKREWLIGHNNGEFYTPEEFKRMQEIALPLQKEGAYQFEFVLPTVTGGRIPVIYNSFINVDSEGRPESINVMVTDIREQKKIQEKLEAANKELQVNREALEKEKIKLEAIIFGIGVSVTVFDLDGNLILSNHRGMQIRGNRITALLPLKSGTNQELTIDSGDMPRQYFGQVEAIRDSEGTPFAFVEILQDITDQKLLQAKEQELFHIKRQLKRGSIESFMIGVSGSMQKVFDLITRCAEVDSSVLILGETGVGKELAARAIHSQSERRDKPFVALNCGALPETLLESELFGHVKGAFTGAIAERIGLFREADGSTLFLDEVADLSGPLQVKILRALQEKEVRPVGGDRYFAVDVRVISSTNKDLAELVSQNNFRNDLYYRLAVIFLTIPPLRNRKEEILPLVEHFIRKHRKKSTLSPVGFDHTAQQLLLEYSWPGNIRELENAVEHALVMAKGTLLTPDDLPVQVVKNHNELRDRSSSNLLETSAQAESEAIRDALRRNNGNRTLAARDLGISRVTLWRKITMYHLD